jgi:hypothetical protein
MEDPIEANRGDGTVGHDRTAAERKDLDPGETARFDLTATVKENGRPDAWVSRISGMDDKGRLSRFWINPEKQPESPEPGQTGTFHYTLRVREGDVFEFKAGKEGPSGFLKARNGQLEAVTREEAIETLREYGRDRAARSNRPDRDKAPEALDPGVATRLVPFDVPARSDARKDAWVAEITSEDGKLQRRFLERQESVMWPDMEGATVRWNIPEGEAVYEFKAIQADGQEQRGFFKAQDGRVAHLSREQALEEIGMVARGEDLAKSATGKNIGEERGPSARVADSESMSRRINVHARSTARKDAWVAEITADKNGKLQRRFLERSAVGTSPSPEGVVLGWDLPDGGVYELKSVLGNGVVRHNFIGVRDGERVDMSQEQALREIGVSGQGVKMGHDQPTAEPKSPGVGEAVLEGQKNIERAIGKESIVQQLNALQTSPDMKFDLFIVPSTYDGPSGQGNEALKGMSKEEVLQRVDQLMDRNDEGESIFIVPRSGRQITLQVDSLETVNRLKRNGFEPALVQDNGTGNFTVVLKHNRECGDYQALKELKQAVVQERPLKDLNGMDNQSRSAAPVIQLAGTRNRAVEMAGVSPKPAIVLEARGVEYSRAAEMEQKLTHGKAQVLQGPEQAEQKGMNVLGQYQNRQPQQQNLNR